MSEVRVPLLDPEEAAAVADANGVGPAQSSLNVYRLLLRRPRMAVAMRDLLNRLLFRSVLDDRLRELAILRIAWVTGSAYEWGQHWSIAQEHFGMRAEDLAAVRDWQQSERFDALDRAVLAAADETLAAGCVGEATWTALHTRLDEESCIDLLLCIGAWQMVSTLLRSARVPLDDDLEEWPPDGRLPDGVRNSNEA